MASASLDQLVKGSPALASRPGSSATQSSEPLAPASQSYPASSDPSSPPRSSTPDPLSTLPSSPPQIYLNLLILESSLRAQYLALRERRRQNTFFLLLLTIWNVYFAYALFLRPREDGHGVGGSVYWVVEMWDKVALMGGVVTALLVWGTGQWERGVRWPRRWLAVANRGLRSMNTKIVIIRGPWWQELLSYLSFLFPFSAPFFPSSVGDFHYIERPVAEKRGSRQHYQQYYNHDTESGLVQEDLSPGGDYIRLLLLPKSFSPEFRENWDEYRSEFWDKENERRTQLRQKLRQKERTLAQQDGGWFWWFGLSWKASQRRRLAAATITRPVEADKGGPHRHHAHHPGISKPNHEPKSPSRRGTRSESHSRTPSRSTTPVDTDDRPPSRSSASGRPRRGSTSPSVEHTHTQPQRKKKGTKPSVTRGLSPLTQAQIREGVRTHSFSSDDSSIMGTPSEKEKPKEDAIE
ncbi:hypothetical protein BO71DRAFT_1658 [Aspergillus ellipticus CBS 707.79]|uniref:Spo7-domain-containing protein n=1 Tax=Aspergillus ellipticus CBS 707.79 TaxID=1448320 RepID=A0A319E118_9EURO|nr:hypothetical protein BO71DRAFT_1658 [Aspergillus ellipticus CBS 707.79]